MSQEIKIIAVTKEVDDNINIDKVNEDLTIFSGKAAGVCYMPDDYTEKGIQDSEKPEFAHVDDLQIDQAR